MKNEQTTVDHCIEFLNRLLAIDPSAVKALIAHRVPCNSDLADHSDVQVSSENGVVKVGMLGILNGLFGSHKGGSMMDGGRSPSRLTKA